MSTVENEARENPGTRDRATDTAASSRAPRRARGQLRVDALLASAGEVFATKGFDAATMTEIAAQADSSIGSLYQFFRTKEAVAEAVVRAAVEELWERVDAVEQAAGAQSTRELAATLAPLLAEFRASHPAFSRLVDAPGMPTRAIEGVRQRLRERLADILQRRAPALGRDAALAIAPVIQHAMKSSIEIHRDFCDGERDDVMRELEAMIAGHLVGRLGP